MKSTFVYVLLPIILASCSTAQPKSKVIASPQAPAQIDVQSRVIKLPALPGSYTRKGVTIKVDGLWQAADGQVLGVSGSAKNVTASDLKFCRVSLLFLNSEGATLDEAKASTKSLKSGQVWHFQAALQHPSQSGYASVTPKTVVAIPVKSGPAELANLK